MKKYILFVMLVTIFFPLINTSPVCADSKGKAKIEDSIEVLEEIVSIPEKGIPPALLNDADGIAIIPGVIKAGFIIGGRHGNGILMVHSKEGGWSNPSFISITGGSIGWQVGVESIDIILVFKSARSIDNIMKGKFTLGADAGISAGPVGRQAEASTDVELKAEIYSYSRSRGLFAGLALQGAVLQIDDDANEAFYASNDITAREIVRNKDLKTPPVVDRLKKLLLEYVSGKSVK
jgi:lipid-binding SYLF domain-containing protein